MITVEDGRVHLKGTNIDIIGDLNSIFSGLLQKKPDLITGVALAWTDELEKYVLTHKEDTWKIEEIITASEEFIDIVHKKGTL